MTFVPVDQQRRLEAIETVDRAVSVDAGAGTGKTTLLVDRVLHLLLNHGCRINELVVVTFTEKAAGELRSRLRFRLEQIRHEPAESPERRQLAGAALEDLDGAHVETIHSFCARTLIEFASEAGLDPRVQVLDEIQSDLLTRETWLVWLQNELERDETPLPRAFAFGLNNSQIKKVIVGADRERRYAAPFHPPPVPDGPTSEAVAALALEIAPRLAELQEVGQPSPSDKAVANLRGFAQFVDVLRRLEPSEYEAQLVEFRPSSTAGAQKNWLDPDALRKIKAVLKDYCALYDAWKARAGAEIAGDLVRCASGYVEFARERRRAANLLDFDDLLIEARDLVTKSPVVRDRLRNRYRYLLIDEFQDTDPAQLELLRALCQDEDGHVGERLFIVGDPKQSIYRFRRADIAMYTETLDRVEQARGLRSAITQNFRSVPGIIDWVNAVFADVFPREPSRTQASYLPIKAVDSPDLRTPVAILREVDPAELNGPKARAIEARAVAAALRMVVEGEWLVRGRSAGGRGRQVRTARWGDCAILVPARTIIPELKYALDAAGIPFVLETAAGFFHQDDVNDLMNVLRAVDSPWDGIAVVAALRSAALACSDADLLHWTTARRSFEYHRSIPQDDENPVAHGLRVLRSLHERRLTTSLPVFVQSVIEESGLLLHWSSRKAGLQHAANLARIVDLARAFTERQGSSLTRFVRWLDERKQPDVTEDAARIDIQNLDAVRIMTIHSAKGLEFEVVVLAGLGTGGMPAGQGRLVIDTAGVAQLRAGLQELGCQTAGYEACNEYEKEREAEELRRLLYVAATRARDHLILSAIRTAKGTTRLDPLLQHVKSVLDVPFGESGPLGEVYLDYRHLLVDGKSAAVIPDVATGDDVDRQLANRAAQVQRLVDIVGKGKQRRPVVSATGLKTWDEQEWVPPIVREADEFAGTEIGTALHRVLERADFTRPDLLAGLCAQECEESAAPVVEAMAQRFLASELGERARRAVATHREMPFFFSRGEQIVTGAMDLVLEELGGLTVVDYKSDVGEPRMDRYRLQAGVYALALRETTGALPGEVLFFFARTGRVEAVTVDAALLDRTLQAVLAAGTRASTGQLPLFTA